MHQYLFKNMTGPKTLDKPLSRFRKLTKNNQLTLSCCNDKTWQSFKFKRRTASSRCPSAFDEKSISGPRRTSPSISAEIFHPTKQTSPPPSWHRILSPQDSTCCQNKTCPKTQDKPLSRINPCIRDVPSLPPYKLGRDFHTTRISAGTRNILMPAEQTLPQSGHAFAQIPCRPVTSHCGTLAQVQLRHLQDHRQTRE